MNKEPRFHSLQAGKSSRSCKLGRNAAGVTDDSALNWASGHYDSIRGRITVAWRRSGKQFELTIEVPANTTATVFVPVTGQQTVEDEELPLDETALLRLGRGKGREMIRVGSGRYRFSARTRIPGRPLTP